MFFSVEPDSTTQTTGTAPTKIIQSQNQYRTCQIKVPDLDKPVGAVCVDGEYYSFFKAVEAADKTLEIVAKLGKVGDSTVITKTPKGYAIWVQEPNAQLHSR
ncbi:MAG TPA: hypothetical protein DEF27_10595 [Oscillatoriales bacterium UBA8482]|nr:MAG: hypothetical protein AUK43_01385 [Oscillatoriales cyanobacterium CG2_30_40_61]HBW58218.1 hypothetical protein [Oscillatoriales bacterium UBA8482]